MPNAEHHVNDIFLEVMNLFVLHIDRSFALLQGQAMALCELGVRCRVLRYMILHKVVTFADSF